MLVMLRYTFTDYKDKCEYWERFTTDAEFNRCRMKFEILNTEDSTISYYTYKEIVEKYKSKPSLQIIGIRYREKSDLTLQFRRNRWATSYNASRWDSRYSRPKYWVLVSINTKEPDQYGNGKPNSTKELHIFRTAGSLQYVDTINYIMEDVGMVIATQCADDKKKDLLYVSITDTTGKYTKKIVYLMQDGVINGKIYEEDSVEKRNSDNMLTVRNGKLHRKGQRKVVL